MEFLSDYGLFLAKTLTLVFAIMIILATSISAGTRTRRAEKEGHIEVLDLNDKYKSYKDALNSAILDDSSLKQLSKDEKKSLKLDEKQKKKKAKEGELSGKPKIFVASFDGDVRASEVIPLEQVITAILSVATKNDEFVLKLESPGGMVHGYGLAASQLDRVKARQIPLTVCVDKVAASGGYMMACIADKIVAAPFAIIGSIGVLAQIPNFNKLLKKHDIDYEMLTAGEYKRTLTVFGENTEKGREKFIEELEDTHKLFKEFIVEHRPQVDIDQVATGEHWYAKRALEKGLVDQLMTSDDYIFSRVDEADIFEVRYIEKRSFPEKLGISVQKGLVSIVESLWDRVFNSNSRQF